MQPPPALAAALATGPAKQGAFSWSRPAWANQMRDLPDVLELLGILPREVDRVTTRDVVLRELDADRVLAAFVAAMVWGHGTTVYGPSRVRWVLTGTKGVPSAHGPVPHEVVTDKLRGAVEVVRKDGAAAAYSYMYGEGRLKYLGGAFFTKWLYFASSVDGVYAENAAPILDQRVTTWLGANARIALHPRQARSYLRYLELLDEWGGQYGRTRVEVEQSIFELTRN
jgi:hypothetical protein